MIKASVIIPTYNEAKNVTNLIEEIFNNINKDKIDLEIILVDDNSPDGTAAIAKNLASRYNIKVIVRPKKLGLGSAVREGFKATTKEIIGVMDGDLSHDPVIINQLILSLNNYDIAIGSRFLPESRVAKWGWLRKKISFAGIFLSHLLIKKFDTLSGYFFLKSKVIKNVNLKTRGYKILFEILIKGKYDRVIEFPYIFRHREYSYSKLNLKEYFLFTKQLISYTFLKLIKLIK